MSELMVTLSTTYLIEGLEQMTTTRHKEFSNDLEYLIIDVSKQG